MADISQVKLPNGDTYNLVDETSGYIKNFTETDPVFSASAAAGITSTDISNWNNKTSNTGTITSVKTTAGQHTTINVSSGAANFNVPTHTSHLTNDSGYITSAKYVYIIESEDGESYSCSETYNNIKSALIAQAPLKFLLQESDDCMHELLLRDTYFNMNDSHTISFELLNIDSYGVFKIRFKLNSQNIVTIQQGGLSVYDGTVE